MKRSLLLGGIAVLLIPASALIELRAQASAPQEASKVTFPYGLECVITLDRNALTLDLASAAPPPGSSGFYSDWTARGQLIYLNDEWCVLKDGTYEDWIPRNKILMIRVSR
jgi:hypothetical protein